jgi:hypothetical protein
VNQIGSQLFDHLIACGTCRAIFAGQKRSLEEAGCIEGRLIVQQTKIKSHEGPVDLKHGCPTDENLDNYIFGRCTSNEQESLAEHLDACSLCAEEIRRRETMRTLLKAVLSRDGK